MAAGLTGGLAGGIDAQDRPTLKRAEGSASDAVNTAPKLSTKDAAANTAGTGDATQVPEGQVQLPEEEDKSTVKKEYSFNPVQSKKEVTVGEFYFKKGDFKAAAGRFLEATRWNAGNAQAWLRLGETAERQKDAKSAREAYEKYLDVATDAKNAGEVKQRVERLKK
jgi:tetratricopeptide (TPR) repeat protein